MQEIRPTETGAEQQALQDSVVGDEGSINESRVEEHKPPFVVGIGASAGGLDSLEKFFRNTPNDTGLAYVVIQHLSPDYKSMMVELLSKYTKMAIKQAEEGMEVQSDTVYLIPPKVSLTISEYKLYLSRRSSHAHVLHLPIDIFFRSLAEDMEGRAIGIILSGTGSDGTLGSRAIKEAGGILMVQDPATAPFDGMPNSVIHTGVADYVLPPEDMPSQLLKYVKHPLSAQADKQPPSSKDEDMLTLILEAVSEEMGVDFSYYKPNTIIRRIERRMGVNQLDKLEHYCRYLESNPQETQILYSELLIGVTRFFRDNEAFDIVQQQVIPEIFRTREKKVKKPLRIWVAGCSSGEEVYSLAILISEYLQEHDISLDTKIFATDIDQRALDIAASGRYPASIVSDVPMPLLSKYFFKSEDYYQVVDKVRKMVIFAHHDLLKDPPFNNLDLVACRNLLIYLKNNIQQKILSMFGFALSEGGFLFLGSSETVGNLSDLFAVFDNKWRIYRYKGGVSFSDVRFFENDRPEGGRSRVPLHTVQRTLPPREPDTLMQRIQGHLLEVYVPPTMVLDHELNLVHTLGDVNQFLQLPKGQVSFNIFKLTDKHLAGLISNAIRKVQKTRKPVQYKDVLIPWKGDKLSLTLLVEPFADDRTKRRFLLVTFQGIEKMMGAVEASRPEPVDNAQELRIQDLEHELQLTRENLQATIEELETSNEELQATNEELMSANEELQSTNEELQSVNEELYTVNSEYQNKIEELTALNNDMDNLLSSTNIGTMFLDRALRIRRFTPAVKDQFPIMDYDIGRPISHFAANFDYPELLSDLQQVLSTQQSNEKDVMLKNGRTYQVNIQPYRTATGVVEGLVITFVDISRRLEMENELRLSEELRDIAAAGSKDGLWSWSDIQNDQGRWSPRCYQLLGYEPGEIPASMTTLKDHLHPQDRNQALHALQSHLTDRTPFDMDCRLRTKSGEYRWYRLRGQAHWDGENRPVRMIGSISDMRYRTVTEQLRSNNNSLYRSLTDASTHFIWLTDHQGKAIYLNRVWYEATGLSEEESLGDGWMRALHPDDASHLLDRWREDCEKETLFTTNGRLLTREGAYKSCQILAIPVGNETGGVFNWVGIYSDQTGAESSAAGHRNNS